MVQFYKISDGGGQQAAGQARLEEGRVIFEDLPEYFTQELMQYGILLNGETLFPEDGEKFLKALPIQYSGSRFRAELIEE